MNEWMVPVLGITQGPSLKDPLRVIWQEGSGILGTAVVDPDALARWDAEQKRKQDLRDRNIAVLEDFRRKEDFNGC